MHYYIISSTRDDATPYTLSMPGGAPLATCTLPVGMMCYFFFFFYYYLLLTLLTGTLIRGTTQQTNTALEQSICETKHFTLLCPVCSRQT
jgi:hypothetical protein